jgi:hypothetical protein
MDRMFCRSFFRLSIFVASLGLAVSSLAVSAQQDNSRRGRKVKVPPLAARIEVTVVRDVNGKPVENAAVVFHPMEGERDKGVMELKTNGEGKTIIDVLPIGDTVRLQIIARGFQTYGEDFKVDKPEMVMNIRLKRPGEQYSIYNNKDASTGKPAGTASQPGGEPKPGEPQPQAK